MKPKNEKRPICISVCSYGPDSLGTRYLTFSVSAREPDTTGDYPSTPRDAVNGVPMSDRGVLEWRFYRSNVQPGYRTGEVEPPRELTADMTEAHYSGLHLVDVEDARQIVKSLDAVEKRMRKMRDTYGPTNDFAEYAMRVAACFEATYVAVDWKLYTEATGVQRRDYNSRDRWRWLDSTSARSFFCDLARIDTTDRCSTCKCPVDRAGLEPHPNECHNCRRARERREREAAGETIPAPAIEPREEDGVH